MPEQTDHVESAAVPVESVGPAVAVESADAADAVESADAASAPAESADVPVRVLVADEVLLASVDLARRALLDVTPAETVGSVVGHLVEDEHVLTLLFAADLSGYPGWHWSVTVARVDEGEPTVLETELMPGEAALLAPDWVPWSERLADYRAAQEAAAASVVEGKPNNEPDGDENDRDEDDDDDRDDEDDEEDDDDLDDDAELDAAFGRDSGDDEFDGIDIDALDDSDDSDDSDDDSGDPGDETDDDDDSDDPEEPDDTDDDAPQSAEPTA